MLTEVRSHANLEHDNIVRYKTTWQGSLLLDEQEIIEQLKLAKFPDQDSDSSIDLGSDSSSDKDSESEKQEQDPKEKEKEEKECLYIALELCEGGTLEDKLYKSSASRPAEPLQILKQMCSAVAYIHNKGLIHRDLKPANIFLQKEKIKIADFGLVTERGKQQEKDSNSQEKEKDSTSQETYHYMEGTPIYMAPEVHAENGVYGKQVDIYSLGIIFLELLMPFNITDVLDEIEVWGGKTRFNDSSFLLYLANWLKDKSANKSKDKSSNKSEGTEDESAKKSEGTEDESANKSEGTEDESANKSEGTEEARKMQQNAKMQQKARIMIDELMKIPW